MWVLSCASINPESGAREGSAPFRADLVCQDRNSEELILIENQLEKTDHTHLGQLLTYAAGLQAVTVVWIAKKFTDEHIAVLSWLNDHDSDVFVVCTANDVSKLPPEFSRSERFDGVFFLDLPSRDEKDAIWKIYRDLYEVDPEQRVPDDTNWTGAEIKSCCRLSALLDLPLKQAAQNVVPVAVTASESMGRLQTWASGRCLSASQSGVYRQTKGPSKTRRRVNRELLNN